MTTPDERALALIRAGRTSVTDLLLAQEAAASIALDRHPDWQTYTLPNTEENP